MSEDDDRDLGDTTAPAVGVRPGLRGGQSAQPWRVTESLSGWLYHALRCRKDHFRLRP